MADQTTLAVGFEGGISNMVPASFVSRLAEGGVIAFGAPVKQGTDDKGCATGIANGDFIGIAAAEAGHAQFEENDEVRVMTQGVIWVKAAGTVKAGQVPSYNAGWTTASGVDLTDARYETGGGNGDLVQIRLWGTNAATHV